MHRKPLVYLALVVGAVFGAFLSHLVPLADASRNSSGTYSLPAGQPVVSGTTISSSVHNALASDIATELTSSLDRSGRGAMLAPLQLTNGTNAAPSLTFATDPDTGFYRAGANNPAISAGGVQAQSWTTAGSTFPLTLGVTGVLSTTHGILATQATTDTAALGAVGNGSAPGITATGGATGAGATLLGGGTSGAGVVATAAAGNSNGGTFTGSGTRPGVYGIGGTTGNGAEFSAGGSTTADTNSRYAVTAAAGHIKLSGGSPAASTAFSNALTPSNIVKSWGTVISDGAGGLTLNSGFNIASVACGGAGSDDFVITLATAFTGTNDYVVIPVANQGVYDLSVVRTSATVFSIVSPTVDCDLGGAVRISFIAVGLQ